MKSVTAKLIAIALKVAVILFLATVGLEYYDKETPFYLQSIPVWALVYLPVFMGYEALINVLFTKRKPV